MAATIPITPSVIRTSARVNARRRLFRILSAAAGLSANVNLFFKVALGFSFLKKYQFVSDMAQFVFRIPL